MEVQLDISQCVPRMAFEGARTFPLNNTSLFYSESFHKSPSSSHSRFYSIPPSEKAHTKPPTILVYTGDNSKLFEQIFETLSSMLPSDTYTIFHLSREALRLHPWISRETACLMLTDTESLDDEAWRKLHQYFDHSGKMLFICQNDLLATFSNGKFSRKSSKILKLAFGEKQSIALGKDLEDFLKKAFRMVAKHKELFSDAVLILYLESSSQQAGAIFSDASCSKLFTGGESLIADAFSRLSIETVHNLPMPSLSTGYFLCSYDRLPWDMKGMKFNEEFGSSPKFIIKQLEKHGELQKPTNTLCPVEYRTRNSGIPEFDADIYFRTLQTSKIGRGVMFFPVCSSTQDLARSLASAMPTEPLVVIAKQQTKGKGRSGNQWLSPIGCAMFSFNYAIPSGTPLADNVGFIQHILCVALVNGICSLHGLQDFPLRIKWPNDIYYRRSFKMGGLLVNGSTSGDQMICTLGAGLNVANKKPTVCINDMLEGYSNVKITVEEFIANALNKFEYYVDIFQTKGREAFLKHYYDAWLHSREEVELSETGEKVVIRGLDEHGFLEVRSRQNGRIMILHPDGNTFDMMKGLISVKY
uniref:BPL/LPL catalytic domain-containing protein n=1 Tax=Syphacia muris TaxID=451379 RepID=A0A158R4T8_9BILA